MLYCTDRLSLMGGTYGSVSLSVVLTELLRLINSVRVVCSPVLNGTSRKCDVGLLGLTVQVGPHVAGLVATVNGQWLARPSRFTYFGRVAANSYLTGVRTGCLRVLHWYYRRGGLTRETLTPLWVALRGLLLLDAASALG